MADGDRICTGEGAAGGFNRSPFEIMLIEPIIVFSDPRRTAKAPKMKVAIEQWASKRSKAVDHKSHNLRDDRKFINSRTNVGDMKPRR